MPLKICSIQFPIQPARSYPLRNLQLAAVLLLTVALNSPSHAQTTDIVLQDGDFNASNWVSKKLTESTGDGTFTATTESSGGNPGSYRHVVYHVQGGTLMVSHVWLTGYSPAQQGPIRVVKYSFDLKVIHGTAGQSYQLLLYQNGTIYVAPRVHKTDGLTSWVNIAAPDNLGAGQFTKIDGPGAANPDFSTNGATIYFGYLTNNTIPQTCNMYYCNPDTSPITLDTGIDNFQVTIGRAGPVCQVSPSALSFTAPFEGDSPPAQVIDIVPTGTETGLFAIALDGGTADTPGPAWIAVNVVNGPAPGRVEVAVHQGTLAVQSQAYQARIRVMDTSGTTTIVPVTLTVANAAPELQVVPHTLHFAARSATPGTLTEILGVRSTGGGGPISFNTSVQDNSTWITGVTPSSGQTVPNTAVFLNVQINTQGLRQGSYHDVIVFTSSAGTVNVPVALFVSGDGAILGLSITGIRFQARQDGGFSNHQTVQVLNIGDPASNLSWTAEFVSGSQFFSATPSSGAATLSSPGTLLLEPTPSALQMPPGGYYGLLKISSTQALNSPLYVVLVLDLESSTTPPLPDPSPAGLVFIATAGKPLATGQLVNINTSSASPAAFQVGVMTADGGSWLTANPVTGTSTGETPGQITVTIDASNLAAGIYSGEVDISMSGELRSVNILVIVLPGGTVAAHAVPSATSCTPAKLALAETGLVNNFSVPAGWPAALTVQLNDDCGSPVSNAFVTASFSNGDPPLMLRPGQSPTYSATWQPGVVSSQMTVTLLAQAGELQSATAQLIGSINQNSNAPPVLSENGTVNVFDRVPAGALAPGMIIEVYGAGLATAKGNPGVLPLPTSFQGTSLIVGPDQAPLYFVSGGQLDVQVAAELTPNQQYPVIAILNGALSIPVMADISPVQLGVAAQVDGHVIAQHGADSSSVDSNHPAKPGEVLVIYLSGMGPTNPSVKSGAPAPSSEPLARVTIQPTVTVDGQNATVQFAGLSPGFVGLYQVNFQVPSNAKSGDLSLMLTQGGVSSNATKLPVKSSGTKSN